MSNKFLVSYVDVDMTLNHMIINGESESEARELFLAYEHLYRRNFHNVLIIKLNDLPVLNDDLKLFKQQ